ncbi:hypothetical protein EJ03DRAFT_329657 [Teratosphaeria nubilosa]|uniref:Pal1-domain-containing protein n=1 Tax=Teratosphaeria nubilosa TaxID=161662 RepID=A0A6G1L1X5_9PEZI|nr:hypothetical protein EJ03DRAFT_329657 [Teratosphaeria nubilosa]
MAAASSKEAQAYLIDPMNAPEPAAETGLNTHFGNTMSANPPNPPSSAAARHSRGSSLGSNNPFRDSFDGARHSPPAKTGAGVSERPVGTHRAEAFGDYPKSRRSGSGSRSLLPPAYEEVAGASGSGSGSGTGRRRGSSLKERYPGDPTVSPLNIIRKDSRKANRSPHLNKRHLPGPDVIDRLDPALGGRAYHHEGPYDAAALARNTSFESSPVAALKTSNEEALKATPAENIKNAVERHRPLEGVADVPPGMPDRFGRTYNYEEGTDMMREATSIDPGYKRWAGKDYDPEDLKGKGDTFHLDRALRAHRIDDDGIEMTDRNGIDKAYHQAQRDGTLDKRNPVDIAGDDRRYVDLEFANADNSNAEYAGGIDVGQSSLKKGMGSIKKRIGSLRHKKGDHDA